MREKRREEREENQILVVALPTAKAGQKAAVGQGLPNSVAVDKRFMGDYRAHIVFCIGTRRQLRNRHSGIFLIFTKRAVGMLGIAGSLLLSI